MHVYLNNVQQMVSGESAGECLQTGFERHGLPPQRAPLDTVSGGCCEGLFPDTVCWTRLRNTWLMTFYDDLWRFMTFCQWSKKMEIETKCRRLSQMSWFVVTFLVNCRDFFVSCAFLASPVVLPIKEARVFKGVVWDANALALFKGTAHLDSLLSAGFCHLIFLFLFFSAGLGT